jgi:aldose 1-epimerase
VLVTAAASGVRAVPAVTRARFGVMRDGVEVDLYTIRAGRLEMRTITYGGIIVSLRTPDRAGRLEDVVLGHETLEGYLDHSPYFGAIVGRYANRIANGRFSLDGETHRLATNDGAQHLHGGHRGFDKTIWKATPFALPTESGVSFALTSPDGTEGYPGTLSASVTYTLTERDELCVEYDASTDRATIVNLSQHSYFNLAGPRGNDVLDHVLTIDADQFTPVDATLIPTGEIAPVDGTPFDFRTPARIGSRIGDEHVQLARAGGYDHNFVLRRPDADSLAHAVRVSEPASGRTLDVRTTEPGLQFYSGNFLDGTIRGKEGRIYGHRAGFCFETQHFPDSPNQPSFPSVVLRPDESYRSRTVFAFGSDR